MKDAKKYPEWNSTIESIDGQIKEGDWLNKQSVDPVGKFAGNTILRGGQSGNIIS